MKKLYLFFSICFVLNCTAQSFYFPKSHYKDSISIAEHMSAIAKSVIKVYSESDKIEFFSNLYRYQLVAKEYGNVCKSIKEMRYWEYPADTIYAKGVAAHFESYALAMIETETKNEDFSTVYQRTLETMVQKLTDKAANNMSSFFYSDLANLKAIFYGQLNAIDGSKDSISLESARQLCRSYNAYFVLNKIIPIGLPYIKTLSVNQLIVEDSVLIKTRDGATLTARIARKKEQVGKLPCVMMFNIYAGVGDRRSAVDIALSGYVGVIVNTRGKYLSSDTIVPYEHDVNDVCDAIGWISRDVWWQLFGFYAMGCC
jgi:uncharacterized protein